MAFDAKDYRNRVLQQYSRGKQPALRKALGELRQDPNSKLPSQFDLAEFYDISLPMTGAEITAQINAAASAMRSAMQMPNGSRQPLDLHELIAQRNPDLTSAEFWVRITVQQSARSRALLAQFGVDASADLSALGVVTSVQLRELAKGSGIPESFSDDELADTITSNGITVVKELPSAEVSAQLLREVSAGVKKASVRSLLSLILVEKGDPLTFSVLDGIQSPDGPIAVSLATVASASAYVDRLPNTDENDATKKTLGAIKSGVKSDSELANLVVAYFIDLGKQIFGEVGAKRRALNAFVERTGISETDAGRILLDVSPDSGGRRASWNDVQALIASGQLKAARRLYETMFAELGGSEADPQKQALAVLEGTEKKVDELRARAASAQTDGDLASAAKALNEALTLCSDDEALTAAALALPPAAPVRFTASVADQGHSVKLSWEAGFGSTDDVRYQIIRKSGSAPKNNADGTPLGSAIAATTFEDTSPPIAVHLFYGVAARRGGGASPVAVADVIVLPAVRDVVVTSDPSSVTVRWTTSAGARTIEVVQTAANGSTTTLDPGSQNAATSAGLRTGEKYEYALTALYSGGSSGTLRSATIRVSGIPRGTPKPVGSLSISALTSSGDRPEVAAEWQGVEGYPVEVWHYDQAPIWKKGSRLAMTEVRARGKQLAGRATKGQDAAEGVQGATEPGLRHYVAITRDGDFGLVGAQESSATVPPISNIKTDRFGDEVVLSWDWPGPEYLVNVRWGTSPNEQRTMGVTEYQTQGGCRIPLGAGGGKISVATVASDGRDEWQGPPSTVTVQGTETAVQYDVQFQKKLLGPPFGAILNFEISPSEPPLDVVVVGHYSKFMPFDADQGSVLKQTRVTSASPQVVVALPTGRKGPVWVRAFAITPGARLVDPPPARMKVD
jgi:hypothetical protein